jgi:hypothetical protein
MNRVSLVLLFFIQVSNFNFSSSEIIENLFNRSLFNTILRNIKFIFILFKQIENFSNRNFSFNLKPIEAHEVFNNSIFSQVRVNKLDDFSSVRFNNSKFDDLFKVYSMFMDLLVDGTAESIFSDLGSNIFNLESL